MSLYCLVKSLPLPVFASLSSLSLCTLSRSDGAVAWTLPPDTRPLSSVEVWVWSLIILSANCLVLALSDFVRASLLDSISSMSLCAAMATKSWAFGATPSAWLTPVFSAPDWAKAGAVTIRIAAEASNNFFMGPPKGDGEERGGPSPVAASLGTLAHRAHNFATAFPDAAFLVGSRPTAKGATM